LEPHEPIEIVRLLIRTERHIKIRECHPVRRAIDEWLGTERSTIPTSAGRQVTFGLDKPDDGAEVQAIAYDGIYDESDQEDTYIFEAGRTA
jgi:hypothetical protein